MKLKDALERAVATDQVDELLASWNVPEDRMVIAEFIHAYLESNEGKLRLKDLGVLCVICIQAGQLMMLPEDQPIEWEKLEL